MTEAPGPAERKWTLAAVIFGVLAPAVLFVIDQHLQMLVTLLGGRVQFAMRACVGLGMATMLLWLWQRGRSPQAAFLLAPLLAFGTVTAFGIGLVLFPFACLGAAAGIGLLGFVPIGTCVVFARAWHDATERSGRPRLSAAVSAAICGVLGVGALMLLALGPVGAPAASPLWGRPD